MSIYKVYICVREVTNGVEGSAVDAENESFTRRVFGLSWTNEVHDVIFMHKDAVEAG
jgi:hypothetical protein